MSPKRDRSAASCLAPYGGLLLLAACGSMRVVDRAADGTPILVRSGQPTEATLRRAHGLYGVKTVVNLRGEQPEEEWFRSERRGVEAIGARWVQLDTSSREAPPAATVGAFFDVLENPDNWPVLVHCEGGVHRTGFLTALYRIQYQGWTAEEAIAELKRNGFRWGSADRGALLDYLRGFEPDPERKVQEKR